MTKGPAARRSLLALLMIAASATAVFASSVEETENIMHLMPNLVFQLGIILFAAHLGGSAVRRFGFPPVLGELLVGIIIGPYLLGALPLPAFPGGIFPVNEGTVPVTAELYGIATIASILLLFMTGLETDLSLFIKYSVAGAIVGIGGVLASFGLGAGAGAYLLHSSFLDPRALFLGIMSTATSVGITARLLSEKRKMDSPEGVTILAAAVIDDVLGIILLAIVLGIVEISSQGATDALPWASIAGIAVKAVGVWLGFTVLGLLFAKRISTFLKRFGSIPTFSILSLGMALLLAGIFEKTGLAMIIGAYVMGLSLSKTDISYVIQEQLHGLYNFFVPVFFTVMGMLVNIRELFSPEVLIFGAVYTAVAVVAKIAGCGLPSLFLNFNRLGALRVGMGMVPRGEVALIIAGIGISGGILNDELFGVSILMTLITTVGAPPLLNMLLERNGRGTKSEMKGSDSVSTAYSFETPELAELVSGKVIEELDREGFFIHRMELDEPVYHLRKDEIFFSLTLSDTGVVFETDPEDVAYIRTLMYECLLDLHDIIEKLKDLAEPKDQRAELVQDTGRIQFDLVKVLDPHCISLHVRGTTKEEIISELVDVLVEEGKISDRNAVLEAVLERETAMSTGMQQGIALPHGKSDGVDSLQVAVGLKPEGADFRSLDGELSKIFILTVSPKRATGPHIQFLATIGTILKSAEIREQLLACGNRQELWDLMIRQTKTGRSARTSAIETRT